MLSFALFFEQLGTVNSGIKRIAVLEEKLSIELLFLFHLLFVRDYGELFSYRLFVFAERTRHGLAVFRWSYTPSRSEKNTKTAAASMHRWVMLIYIP